MEPKRLQVFETKQVRVTYDPEICRDSGVCLRSLAQVFDRGRQPWVEPGAATPAQVLATVARCPSGALRAQLVTSVFRTGPDGGTR